MKIQFECRNSSYMFPEQRDRLLKTLNKLNIEVKIEDKGVSQIVTITDGTEDECTIEAAFELGRLVQVCLT